MTDPGSLCSFLICGQVFSKEVTKNTKFDSISVQPCVSFALFVVKVKSLDLDLMEK